MVFPILPGTVQFLTKIMAFLEYAKIDHINSLALYRLCHWSFDEKMMPVEKRLRSDGFESGPPRRQPTRPYLEPFRSADLQARPEQPLAGSG
jgi:hypothetical protein